MFNADSKSKRNSALVLIEIFGVTKINLSVNAYGDVFCFIDFFLILYVAPAHGDSSRTCHSIMTQIIFRSFMWAAHHVCDKEMKYLYGVFYYACICSAHLRKSSQNSNDS